MKSLIRFALLLLLASSSISFARDDPETEEFRRLEVAWSEAIRAQDRTKLESFLAPEYTLTAAQPTQLSVTDRAEWLQNATTGYKLHEFTFKQIVVRRYGNVAVVSSFYTQRATVNGRDRSGDAFLTDVWVKVRGKWKVSARYSSSPKASTPKVPA
ncbi:nuclear transport factor 2 family protein [Lysobacter xanthus]